jgi:uncharacterized membrane protein YfcA
MDSNLLLGYFGALIIGIVLGLVGGGGSILTVPIFVYLLAIEPVMATAYSLFVVGAAAAIGAFRNLQKGLVDVRTAVVFAIPAFIAVYTTRRFLIPAIPEELGSIWNIMLTRDIAIMVFFAIIMLLAAVSMIRDTDENQGEDSQVAYNYPMIIIEGLVVGLVTGIVGAGGGFLIIPALVLLAKLPMKKAVGTSLLIIAFKSLIGFIGDVQNVEIDWSFLLRFTGLAILGIMLGIYLSNFIEGKKLKKGFGYFVLLMGFYIIWKELVQ